MSPWSPRIRAGGGTSRRLTVAATATAAALVLLIVAAGPATRADGTQKVWINGGAKTVSAYASVAGALRASPGDWPKSTLIDIGGDPIGSVETTPAITVNGSLATLDTPLAPYSRVEVSAVADVGEDYSTEVHSIPGDPPPRIWNVLWQAPTPGTARIQIGETSGKRSAPEIVVPPVAARSLSEQPVVALTFDDGPDPTWTAVVLDILSEKGVKATFFALGSRVQAYPDLVRRAAAEGHAVQNHSWNHPQGFGALPFETVLDEMAGTSGEIEAITGKRPTYFRPPGGGLSPEVEAAAAQLGMYITMWNVDPQDWAGRNSDEIFAKVANGLGGGDLVLLHDGGGDRGQTTAALPGIIDDLRAKGFTFVTLG